jgi:hypothetical protein
MKRAGDSSSGSAMTPKQALAFVKKHGVVLQAARGPVPSFAEHVAGGPISGSWWSHSRGHEIFGLATAVCESGDVLVCKLIDGKVTYVHRRLWPPLVKLAARFDKAQLAKVDNEHTNGGAHRSTSIPFPDWVPNDVRDAATHISLEEAERALAAILTVAPDTAAPTKTPKMRPRKTPKRRGVGLSRRPAGRRRNGRDWAYPNLPPSSTLAARRAPQ